MLSEKVVLKKLRVICLRLPAATEGVSFGHPTFRIEGKMFAVLGSIKAISGSA